MEKYSKNLGKNLNRISEQALKVLVDYDYSGNVRELENIIERAVTLEPSNAITAESLPASVKSFQTEGVQGVTVSVAYNGAPNVNGDVLDLEKKVEEFEKAIIKDALRRSGGVKKKAAELLGLSFRSMRYKLSKYDIPED